MAKILIVDDDENVRKILYKLLSSKGHDVITVSDPLNAFAAVKANLPEFIILDIMLPFVRGDELLIKIKKNYPSMKVIVLSGYDDNKHKNAMISSGAELFISKSENILNIIEQIDNFIANFYPSSQKPTKCIKVLVVDDDEQIRKIVSKFSKEKGCSVCEAPNAIYALELIKKDDFDLILLDIFMPEMNGEEFISKVFSIKPDIKIIVVSGNETEEIAKRMITNGAFDYIKKPINFKQLETIFKVISILKEI